MATPRDAGSLVEAPRGAFVVPREADGVSPIRLSVVVPTYNEREAIVPLVRAIAEHLGRALPGGFEIVVVDDDSPDRTWEVALEAAAGVAELRVVRRCGERGLATAVVRGWQVARGDVLAVIDGDLQHPPEVLLDLWRAVEGGADLAVASRHVAGGGVSDWSLRRRALSRGAQLLALMLLPGVVGRVSDPMSGYFMIRRGALAGRELSPLGYKILVEVLARSDVRTIREHGYVFRERAEGGSKVAPGVYLDYVRHLVRVRARLATGG